MGKEYQKGYRAGMERQQRSKPPLGKIADIGVEKLKGKSPLGKIVDNEAKKLSKKR